MILRIVDLFSGLHSWTQPFKKHEARIFSLDNNTEYQDSTSMIADILSKNAKEWSTLIRRWIGGRPHVLYASIPCTCFSVASFGHHWGGGHRAYIPKTPQAKQALKMTILMNEIILELNPDIVFIENPRGMLRKIPTMIETWGDNRITLWYCQYGPTAGILRAKPTDIWGRWPDTWKPRPECKNNNPECRHVRAKRGAKTGTQGLKNNAVRSMIPKELCKEIYDAIKKHYLLQEGEVI